MKALSRFKFFLLSEVKNLLTSKLQIVVALVMPFVAGLILVLIFKNGFVVGLPVAIVDNDNSSISRQAIRSIHSTQAVDVDFVTSDYAIAEKAFKAGEVYSIIVFDKEFSESLSKRKGAGVNVISNGFYLMYAKVAYKAIAQALIATNSEIHNTRLIRAGFSRNEAQTRANPLSLDISTLGNPYLSYTIYLIPGMLVSLIQMSGSFSALWIFREHREHAASRISPPAEYRMSWLSAKFFPILLMNLLSIAFTFSILLPFAGIPIGDKYYFAFGISVLLAIVSIGMGAFLSLTMSNLVSAAQALLVINAPAFVFSGLTFPRWAMPDVIKSFAEFLPSTQAIDAIFPIVLYNELPSKGLAELAIMLLVVWGLLSLAISPLGSKLRELLRNQFSNYKEKEINL